MRGIALGAALALGIAGCGGEAPPPGETPASLLFVSLDTFRADAAGCGGDPAARTPHLDRLVREGVQFRAAVTACPLTLPAHATLLTGLDPPFHGVRDNGTFRLPDSVATLAAAVGRRGLATGAFLGAFPLDARFGLARGFDHYDDDLGDAGVPTRLLEAQRPGDEVVESARRWWATLPAGQRWFAWVHLFDAHAPHDAPAPLVRACGGRPYAADASLADRFLGAAVHSAREVAPNVFVVVVGDHGEGLGDHGEATHGLFVYGSTVRVPAVIHPAPPPLVAGLHDVTFRGVDLPATVFDLLGFDPEDAPGAGRSAGRTDAAPRPAYFESLYALLHHGWAPLRGVEDGRWKYVSAPEPELYDLVADPGERWNVAADHPEEVARLGARLDELADTRTPDASAAGPLDEPAREALESLGYATGRAGTGEGRPDPKRRLAIHHELESAQRELSQGRAAEALATLEALAARAPQDKDIRQTLGVVYTELGRHADAVEAFQAALQLPPHRNDRIARFELASAHIRLGEPAQAIPHLERLADDAPNDPAIWYNLGVAWNLLGQRRNAERAWKRALRADPGFRAAEQALEGVPDSR